MISQGIGVGWDLERERERGLPSTPLLLVAGGLFLTWVIAT